MPSRKVVYPAGDLDIVRSVRKNDAFPGGEHMREYQDRFRVELAGALTPELAGAAHSRAHGHRTDRPAQTKRNRGEKPSEKSDSHSEPRQP